MSHRLAVAARRLTSELQQVGDCPEKQLALLRCREALRTVGRDNAKAEERLSLARTLLKRAREASS